MNLLIFEVTEDFVLQSIEHYKQNMVIPLGAVNMLFSLSRYECLNIKMYSKGETKK